MGLTGVITEATLRLQPVETSRIVCDTERAADVDDCMARMLDGDDDVPLLGRLDRLPGDRRPTSVARCCRAATTRRSTSCRRRSATTARAVRAAHAAGRAAVDAERAASTALSVARVQRDVVPQGAARSRAGHVEGIKPFFFPLDGVRGWNRIYGSRGFVQYQFVVPYGAERRRPDRARAAQRGAHAVVPRGAEALRARQPVAVGFPIAGWTLALDIPAASPGSRALLDELDELVVDAGGRVYLTKDARLRPELLARDVPAARRVARGAGRARPATTCCAATWTAGSTHRHGRNRDVKDALGEVQSVLVLGGDSDIARWRRAASSSRDARARVVLAARKPEACDAARRRAARARARRRCTRVAFDATDFGVARGVRAARRSTGSATSTSCSSRSACSATRNAPSTTRPPRSRSCRRTTPASVSVAVPLVERLRAQGHGTIVVLSSVAGERVRRSNFVYGVVEGRRRRLLPGPRGRARPAPACT